MRFAERRLYWSGAINRTDMTRLREEHPGALLYDTVGRTYRAAPGSRPAEPGQGELLRELRLIAEGQLDRSESVLAQAPPLAIAETPECSVGRVLIESVSPPGFDER